jgi:hypothetical protein
MMPDHPHTIDRWDDTTGETLIEQIAGVTDCQNNDMADAEPITPQTHQWTPPPPTGHPRRGYGRWPLATSAL